MTMRKLGFFAPILVIAGALLMLAVSTHGADAAKPEVQLSYRLYSFEEGTFVVDYAVPGKGTGKMDLAVRHQCFAEGQLVQSWTNRLYWIGNGANREGHWNTEVGPANECFAVAVDLAQPTSSTQSLTGSGYAEVSPTVHYVVQ